MSTMQQDIERAMAKQAEAQAEAERLTREKAAAKMPVKPVKVKKKRESLMVYIRPYLGSFKRVVPYARRHLRMISIMAAIVVVVVAGSIAAYLYLHHESKPVSNARVAIKSMRSVLATASDINTASYPIYTSTAYGFSLKYPPEMRVSESAASTDGSHTITFQNAAGDTGFQIYITPYTGAQITKSQILKDTNNTATDTPQQVIVGDGINALIFHSSSPLLGQLREVWLIHGGYLYEVTSYADLDTWMAQTMDTWRFSI